MPKWAGKWKGGRFYLDDQGRPVYFIERRKRSVRLKTHDEELALGELARFLRDPVEFCRPPPAPEIPPEAVLITGERLELYLAHLRGKGSVDDHKAARRAYLLAWANWRDANNKPIDLRTVDKKTLRIALASFSGGFPGRVEALNAFANFLVKEGDQGLTRWNRFVSATKSKQTRAERVAYSIDELSSCYARLKGRQRMRDVLVVRASTGLHHTEIEQLQGCKIFDGPLPDKGAAIRVLPKGHEIAGVLQVRQKTKPRHRVSVPRNVLDAALRLQGGRGVPSRISVYKAFAPLVPSNLRHTWITLCGEVGSLVTYKGGGVSLDQIQQIAGHRIGSKVTTTNYDKLQIPTMIRLPLKWEVLDAE